MVRRYLWVGQIVSLLLLLGLVLSGCSTSTTVVPTATPEVTEAPPATPLAPKKIVVLYSYEEDFWATADEDIGVLRGLAAVGYVEGENLEVVRMYMDTKTVNKTSEQMADLSAEILDELAALEPDVLILFDDNALQHVGAKLLDSDLPVVFSGINGFPTKTDYGWVTQEEQGALLDSFEQPGHNITGVLERISFSSGFDLIKKLLPDAETALFISDDSAVTNLFMEGAGGNRVLSNLAIDVVEQVYTNDFELLKSTILDYQEKVDVIVMFLPWTLEDENGEPVPQQDVVRWFVMNSKRPSIGFLDVLPEEGYLCGVVVDMELQGFQAGLQAGEILTGRSPADMPVITPTANRILLNLARAEQLGIEIPFDVFQVAADVFKSMSVYPEYEMSEQ